MHEITHILNSAGQGDANAANELLAVVYDELRRVAAATMALESPGQTLQATALVHEAWLRLSGDEKQKWNDRTHFFAAAAEAMRRILVDNARRKRAQRHGGGYQRVDLPEIVAPAMRDDDRLLAVHEALKKFATLDPQKAEVVKLRYFVGMTTEETAKALGISVPTADRHWAYSRAWLAREIRASE